MTPQTKQQSAVETTSTDTAVPITIATQVAAKDGVDPLELPPLHTAVDADALTALLDHSDAAAELEVTFSYAGYTVAVTGDGTVSVQECR